MAAAAAKPAGSDLTSLKGVGPALAEKLARLGVHATADLLFLLPLRYEDRTRVTPLGALRAGQRAVIEAEIQLAEVVFRRRRSLLVRIADGTGQLTLRFFYFSRSQQNALVRGHRVRCYGEVRGGPAGLEIVHPEYRVLKPGESPSLPDALTPVYPSTEGLTQPRLRGLVDQALATALPGIEDLLPPAAARDGNWPTLAGAVRCLHRPPPGTDLELLAAGRHASQRRLALEEMLAHHLSLRLAREAARAERAVPVGDGRALTGQFIDGLPFRLTGGQAAALADIEADLAKPQPMMRLVQGDVGCGKTVVAAAAALRAIESGTQAVLMAPTELLAEQHRDTLAAWLEPMGISIAWLSGSQRQAARREALAAIESGEAQLIVGTHALFQEAVAYHRLGLVIVDEQHRFGVAQRLSLMQKAAGQERPHQLVMTATPIPRTLAMIMYADLDVSLIRELPPGRQPVTTVALPESRRDELVTRVREACRGGAQAYWVCPLIEESEHLDSQAAESVHAMLAEALPGIEVGLVHGRLAPTRKDKVMKQFAAGKLKVLVATTVIEVGVDVPNATLMVIENAERMGLSQLHQLRGRVGRGSGKSSCVLLYSPPLGELARERLSVMRDSVDGFVIAEKDLELRGPGEVMGTRQTGMVEMRVADLLRDADLVPEVRRLAGEIIDAGGDAPERLIRRWIGDARRYREV